MRTLATDGQSAAMTQTAVRTDFHKPFDVERHFLAKIALYAMLLFDDFSDLIDLFIVQFTHFRVEVDRRFGQNAVGLRPANPENVGQCDFDSLVRRKIHTGNTGHLENLHGKFHALSLSLLVFSVDADDSHYTFSVHQLALVTNLFY
jgi:hypothetical protein